MKSVEMCYCNVGSQKLQKNSTVDIQSVNIKMSIIIKPNHKDNNEQKWQ